MPCCCINTLNLCNKPVCGSIVFDKKAVGTSGSGEPILYLLVLDFLESTLTLSEAQTDGENIHFDISMLNENFQYTGQVFDSEGNLVTFDVDAVVMDCIKFKTIMNVSI